MQPPDPARPSASSPAPEGAGAVTGDSPQRGAARPPFGGRLIIPIFERTQIASYADMAGSNEGSRSGGISSGVYQHGGYTDEVPRYGHTGHRGVEVFAFGGVRQA